MKDIFLEIGLFLGVAAIGIIAISWILVVIIISILTDIIAAGLALTKK
jgi:hypothetical protein